MVWFVSGVKSVIWFCTENERHQRLKKRCQLLCILAKKDRFCQVSVGFTPLSKFVGRLAFCITALSTCFHPLCLYPACLKNRHLTVLNPSCGLMASWHDWQPFSIGVSFLFLTGWCRAICPASCRKAKAKLSQLLQKVKDSVHHDDRGNFGFEKCTIFRA